MLLVQWEVSIVRNQVSFLCMCSGICNLYSACTGTVITRQFLLLQLHIKYMMTIVINTKVFG